MSGKGETVWRIVALAGLAAGVAALALQLTGGGGERTRAAAPSVQRAAAPAVPALAGRSATLSRLLSDRRAVARVELVFGAKGVLDATCRAEAADGAVSACFGDEKGTGTWSVEGASLCIAAPVLGLAAPHCYEVSGAPPALILVGPGFLAGSMQLR
jgi:hypothetical protein